MAYSHNKKSGAPRDDLDRPWVPGDDIPAPEAIHKDSESVWAMWNEVTREHEHRFAETAPMTLPPSRVGLEDAGWSATLQASGAPLSGPRPAPGARGEAFFTLEAAMLVARRNNRVCPRPYRWSEFMALLPPRKTARGELRPPAPVTGAAWNVTPSLTKRLCFREQIEWAESAGVLESAMDFMMSLSEGDWLHMGED